MRRLRYSAAMLLTSAWVASAACRPIYIVEDDDDNAEDATSADPTTAVPSATTAPPTPPPMDDDDDGDSTSDDGGSGSGDTTMSMTGSQGQRCGNGIIEGTEQCDCGEDFCSPAGLGGSMCGSLTNPSFPDRVYTGGVLNCNMASCQFDFSTCTFCGDSVLNGTEICELGDNGPSCSALGEGTSNSPLPCGINCQWDVTCCPNPPPEECQ